MTLVDMEVGDGATVCRTQGSLSVVGPGATVGPWAYLRPGTELGAEAKIGTFVETKNANIGAGVKDSAPVLRRRRNDRHRDEHRCLVGLRQLRRGVQAPHDGRRPLPDGQRHDVCRARDVQRVRAYSEPGPSSAVTFRLVLSC